MYAVMANRGHSGGKPAPPTVTLPLPLPVDGSKPLAGKRAGVYWKVGTRGSGAVPCARCTWMQAGSCVDLGAVLLSCTPQVGPAGADQLLSSWLEGEAARDAAEAGAATQPNLPLFGLGPTLPLPPARCAVV